MYHTQKKLLIISLLLFGLLCNSLPYVSFAENSDAEALLEEGWKYFNGDGVVQDIPKGISMIVDAGNAGSVQAMLEVAYLYNYGFGALISEDFVLGTAADNAIEWIVKVADAGEVELAKQSLLSCAFDFFLGSSDGSIPEDDEAALKFFQKAAEFGDPSAAVMMAMFYNYGFGVPQDPMKALSFLTDAASSGSEEASYTIEDYAYAFYAGTKDGIDINFGYSFRYYEALANLGNSRAMYNLGLLYQYGLGIAPDKDKAVELFTNAADAGFRLASEQLTQISKE